MAKLIKDPSVEVEQSASPAIVEKDNNVLTFQESLFLAIVNGCVSDPNLVRWGGDTIATKSVEYYNACLREWEKIKK